MSRIKHVVVLMLENRSFDHVLGWLAKENPAIDGLRGAESNPTDVASPLPTRVFVSDRADWQETLPFDPPHEFSDVTEQIFGTVAPRFGQQAREKPASKAAQVSRKKRMDLVHGTAKSMRGKGGSAPGTAVANSTEPRTKRKQVDRRVRRVAGEPK